MVRSSVTSGLRLKFAVFGLLVLCSAAGSMLAISIVLGYVGSQDVATQSVDLTLGIEQQSMVYQLDAKTEYALQVDVSVNKTVSIKSQQHIGTVRILSGNGALNYSYELRTGFNLKPLDSTPDTSDYSVLTGTAIRMKSKNGAGIMVYTRINQTDFGSFEVASITLKLVRIATSLSEIVALAGLLLGSSAVAVVLVYSLEIKPLVSTVLWGTAGLANLMAWAVTLGNVGLQVF